MDNFEKHIRENVEQFDVHKADRAKMWANISTELAQPEVKVIPLWKQPIFRIAASIILFIGIIGFIAMSLFSGASETQFVSKELLDVDTHYKVLVSSQVELVKNNPNLSDVDKVEFLSFMEELDNEYEILKNEMQKNLDNERILEAIVANYKKRIELIENLLLQINDSKKIDEDYGYTL